MKKRALVLLFILLLVMTGMVMAQTQYWYLLEGEDAYVICPTTLEVEQLAPNAIHMTCAGGMVYMPHIQENNVNR